MSLPLETAGEVQPFAQESWADQTSYTYIDDINVLALNGAMKYVGQREIYDFHPKDDPRPVGSDGFGKCSGLIIRDPLTNMVTVSHLEPSASEFHTQMKTGSASPVKWPTIRDIVLVYGSVSSPQYDIEKLASEQFWGPATLRTVHLETGRAHWGMVYYGVLGQLAVLRKTPDQSVFRYQLFEPITE